MLQHERQSHVLLMRRFMWSLNDEVRRYWLGAPETMAEIMARHQGLAARGIGLLGTDADIAQLEPLLGDNAETAKLSPKGKHAVFLSPRPGIG